ncbi:MAG: thiamine pyrophosphate-dependent enzyme [Alphaproteobacteria bacterium]|nr:thiamine pyrophosphate-dependent enzyme [Alphaproteobacteria bacterium]MDP6815488.1 thiamine pyrophosphate-dependent enzyme [Alphaproteobacteria bacterium]
MASDQQRFVDWLAARLSRAGTARAFGVPGGGGSLDLVAALRQHGIDTLVTAREDAAVIMAGVSGLLAQAPGLAFTTKGPGLASASNGLAAAALDRLPALLIAEAFDDDELGYLSHQVYDQAALVAPLLGAGDADLLPAETAALDAWIAQGVLMPCRPAVLLPSSAAIVRLVDVPADALPPEPTPPSARTLETAQSLLASSRRPAVVVGLEAARPEVSGPLRDFVARLGAPALSTYMAKGCIADTAPGFAGIFTGGAIEQACLRQADLIILVGLDPVEMIRKPWSYEAPVLDLCAAVHDPHYLVPQGRVVGPLAGILGLLAGDLDGSDWQAAEIAGHRQYFLDGMAAGGDGGLSSAAIVKAAAAAFGAGPRLTVDAGAHMFSACAFWPCAEPLDLLISNGLASMGFALPAGLAAALHEPARGAVVMTGDGGLLMCLGELKTAAEANANVCVMVFNDGRLSLIDIKRQERQFPDIGMSWRQPDFAAVARGFGFEAWRIDDAGELAPALAAAAAGRGPRLIDLRVDPGGYNDQIKALRGSA